jgi:hypothetical protein
MNTQHLSRRDGASRAAIVDVVNGGLAFAFVLLSAACGGSPQPPAAPPPASTASAPADPLPSWNDGASKKAIVDFVARVTREGGPDFVPVPERIATFDNDGTLWSEKPVPFQMVFAFDQVKAMAAKHPEWKTKEPFAAVLKGDMAGIAASGEKGVLAVMAATHAGMTTDEFSESVRSSCNSSTRAGMRQSPRAGPW